MKNKKLLKVIALLAACSCFCLGAFAGCNKKGSTSSGSDTEQGEGTGDGQGGGSGSGGSQGSGGSGSGSGGSQGSGGSGSGSGGSGSSEKHAADTSSWQKDASGHYHKCTVSNCSEKFDSAPHVYDDDSDASCNVCGFTRTIISGPVAGKPTVKAVSSDELECAYIEWTGELCNAKWYSVYTKADGASSWSKLDDQLIRQYPDKFRADAVGLKAGTYSIKIVPVSASDEESAENATVQENVTVRAHDRSGYAFVNGTSSGAYNDDGTLKSNAVVLYVTNENKDTVTVDGVNTSDGPQAVGLQQILDAWKKQDRPLDVRFIGQVRSPKNTSSNDPNTVVVKEPSSKSPQGVTLEGVGCDTTAYGWTLRVVRSTNVEIRNLACMMSNAKEPDGITIENQNDHIWVHNCDFFYLGKGSDADQAKGDGALDTKESAYITHSYNHFWDSGKCNLQGMKSESVDNYITYHHNWYDHSDSRHPRIRTCTTHIYNNYFDGNAKYGVGVTKGASAFVENNYFRSTANMRPMLSSGQGTDALGDGTFSGEDGGIIKSFGNKYDCSSSNLKMITYQQNNTSFDCYEASSRGEQIPSSVKALKGGTSYTNFDTQSSFYKYTPDTPDQAKENCIRYAGRVQGGDIKYTFNNSVEDSNYGIIPELKALVDNYSCKVVKIAGAEVNSGSTTGGSTGGGTGTGEGGSTGGESGGGSSAPVSGQIIYVPATDGTDGKGAVTVSGGSYKSGSDAVTINGVSIASGKALKVNSGCTLTFTLSAGAEVIVYCKNDNVDVKEAGDAKATRKTGVSDSGCYKVVMTLAAGTYTISKGGSENQLFMLIINPS